MNTANGPPEQGRRFYTIQARGDGLADIYLDAQVHRITLWNGAADYSVSVKVVKGINPADYEDLEAHVREHYESWREMAETVWI